MKKIILILMMITMMLSANKITEASKSVVRLAIETDKGLIMGTAFSINKNGYYITNHHVIEEAVGGKFKVVAIKQMLPEKEIYPVEIIWYSQEKDLAIIKIKGLNFPPLKFYKNSLVEGTLSVNAIGFPVSADRGNFNNKNFTAPKITSGTVASVPFKGRLFEKSKETTYLIQHDAAINGGNSGGPLVDDCGRVVGVNVQKAFGDAQGIYYAIAIDEVKEILENKEIDYEVLFETCSAQNSIKNILFVIGLFLVGLFIWIFIKIDKNSKKTEPSNSFMMQKVSEYMKLKKVESAKVVNLYAEDNKLPVIVIKEGEPISVGHAQSNDISIENTFISSKHIIFTLKKNQLMVEDVGSTNGSYIDGRKLESHRVYSLEKMEKLILGSEEVIYVIGG